MPSWYQTLREMRVRETRYANYHIIPVGEIASRFLSNRAQKASYAYPKSRKCLILAVFECIVCGLIALSFTLKTVRFRTEKQEKVSLVFKI